MLWDLVPMTCRFCILIALLAAAVSGAHAQTALPADAPQAQLRTTTRLVLLDVVVTDKSGKPVAGLTADQFTVTEQGKPQKISVFSPAARAADNAANPPLLPPNVTTNLPVFRKRAGGATVLMLLDAVNTPAQNQVYVRQQMLRWVADQLKPDMRVAVLTLTNTLNVLQDFSSDPVLLKAALERYRPTTPAVAHEGSDKQGAAENQSPLAPDAPTINTPSQAGGAGAAATARATGGGEGASPLVEELQQAAERFEKENASFALDDRVRTTLAALREIAHYVAGFPGRKSLLWFSASFPVDLAMNDIADIDTFRNYAAEVRTTTNLLSDAHVAIYPIDARGLFTDTMTMAEERGPAAGAARPQLGLEANRTLQRTVQERFAREATMEHVADDTGGRVFRSRNDIDQAIAEAVADESAYYVIGYYPANKKWDGNFREVKVHVSRAGLQVRTRRGYYAIDPDSVARQNTGEMVGALKSGALPSTEVLFYARVTPPATPKSKDVVAVDFLVNPQTVSFETQSENTKFCSLRFEVEAYNTAGKLVRAEVQTAEAPLKPETFQRVERTGIPMQVSIKLQPGTYKLRLGVRDNRTGFFGTSDLPVTVAAAQ
jgi:VWFA-related protein